MEFRFGEICNNYEVDEFVGNTQQTKIGPSLKWIYLSITIVTTGNVLVSVAAGGQSRATHEVV